MNEQPPVTDRMRHGEGCSCRLLARACRTDPRALSFEYCKTVLQKHWRMTCRHGEPANATAATGDRWRDVGTVDLVTSKWTNDHA